MDLLITAKEIADRAEAESLKLKYPSRLPSSTSTGTLFSSTA